MPQIDYNALAAQARGGAATPAAPPAGGAIDYNALAAQARGEAATAPTPAPPIAGLGGQSLPGIPAAPTPNMHPAELPQTATQRLLGTSPLSTATSVGSHLKNLVAAPYHAFVDQPRNPEEQAIKGAVPADGGAANSLGQFGLGVARMFVNPTVDGLKTASAQYKAGNTSLNAPEYDAQGNYTPSVASGIMDAVPLAGSWARGIENEAHQKGALPALAGMATDVAAPKYAHDLIAPTMSAVRGIPEFARGKLAGDIDAPLPDGSGHTPATRYAAAKRVGVQPNAADATNSPILDAVRRATEHSAAGSSLYDNLQGSNMQAMSDRGTGLQTAMSGVDPLTAGTAMQTKLQAPFLAADDAAAKAGVAAQNTADDFVNSKSPLTGEKARLQQQANLQADQERLQTEGGNQESEIRGLVGDQPVSSLDPMRSTARTIMQQNAPADSLVPGLAQKQTTGIMQSFANMGEGEGATQPTIGNLLDLRTRLLDAKGNNNELVSGLADKDIDRMIGAVHQTIDGSMPPGGTPAWENANAIWRDMKETYDTPQSPFYSAVRGNAPQALTQGIGGTSPAAIEAMRARGADLGIVQRGNAESLFGNGKDGQYDLGGFGRRLYQMPEENRAALFGDDGNEALTKLAADHAAIEPTRKAATAPIEDLRRPAFKAAPETLVDGIGPRTGSQMDRIAPMVGPEGVGALQRGELTNLMGTDQNGAPNWKTFGRQLALAQSDPGYHGSLFGEGPGGSATMNDLATTSNMLTKRPNTSGTAGAAQKTGDIKGYFAGAGLAADRMVEGHPGEAAVAALAAPVYNAAMYGTSKLMNSPRFADWLMKQPGEAGPGMSGVAPMVPPTAPPEDPNQGGPKIPTPVQPQPLPTYGTKEVEPGATLPIVKPAEPSAPGAKPKAPQPRDAAEIQADNERAYNQALAANNGELPGKPWELPKPKAAAAAAPAKAGKAEAPPPPLFRQAPQYEAPLEAKMQDAAPMLPKGPDLSHLGESSPGLNGASTKLKVAGEEEPMQARYRVMEADDITPSHNAQSFAPNEKYPAGVQERDYGNSNEEQMKVIGNAQKYDPAMTVNDDPTAVGGPPIVTPNGIALGGNSRVMSTQRLYDQASNGKGFSEPSTYRDMLQAKASQYGLDPAEIAKMKKPVLVREVQSALDQASLHKLGTRLNKPFTAALGTSAKAVSMGKTISPTTIQYVRGLLQDGGTLREAMGNPKNTSGLLKHLQDDGAISNEERPQYVDTATGGMNENGKALFEKAMLGSVMGDANLMDTAPKNVTAKLNASVGTLSELNARPDTWNIIPQLRTAIGEHTKMAAANMGVDDYLKQGSMFGKPLTPVEDHLTRVLADNPNAVRDGFASYGKDARYALPGQATFLGPEPHDAFNHAFKANLDADQFAHIKPLAKN